MTSPSTTLTRERADLIESLRRHRDFLRFTVRGLTDEQATQRPTVSALNLAGLIKHVAATEASWVRFAEGGAEAMSQGWGPDAWSRHWHLQPGETLAGLRADYEEVAKHTDDVVATADLDADHARQEAPWFEPGVEQPVDSGHGIGHPLLVLGGRAVGERFPGHAECDVGDGDVEVDLVDGRDGRAHGDLLTLASTEPNLGRRYDGNGARK